MGGGGPMVGVAGSAVVELERLDRRWWWERPGRR